MIYNVSLIWDNLDWIRGDTCIGNNDRGRHIPNERPKRLIDRPKGQAGRSVLKGGYNLQEAMGLGDDNRKYNAFRVSHMYYTSATSQSPQDDRSSLCQSIPRP